MRNADTVDKIVQVYIAGLCREEFIYKSRQFKPKNVVVSPLIVRGYTCPSSCGACCGSFSLDYLPNETAPREATLRIIQINNVGVPLISDKQRDVNGRWCRHLDRLTGRCQIYNRRPFACDFELIRLLHFENKVLVTQKKYGRWWAMPRLDGLNGAFCEMLPANSHTKREVLRKFLRLNDWAQHFNISTCVPEIIDWLQHGDDQKPYYITV